MVNSKVNGTTESVLADKDLVASAQAGSKEAFRVLVERYQNRAFSIALDIVRSKEDAEDVIQESFVKAYLSLKDFRGNSSFYTWFYRIVYNMAIDFRRRVGRRGGQHAEFDESLTVSSEMPSADMVTPQESVLRKEEFRAVGAALNEISEEHRAVIMLREVDGLSYDEIADVVGVTKGTVMSRLHYARKKLQKVLSEFSPKGTRSDQAEQDELTVEGLGKGAV